MNEKITELQVKEALSKSLRDKISSYREIDENALYKAMTLLINHLNYDEEFNPNVMISADDPKDANEYGRAIAAVLEELFPVAASEGNNSGENSFEALFSSASKYTCAAITEQDLYKCRGREKDFKDKKVLVVTGLKATNIDNFFETLSGFANNKWSPAVVLCTDSETVEKLKGYDAQDYRLYAYLCGKNKIFVPSIDEKYIVDTVCERFRQKGLTVKDDFKEKLDNYVRAVYPEAVLQKEEFLEDLIERINQERFEKSVEISDEIDGSVVPYSTKAENLWNEKNAGEPEDEESGAQAQQEEEKEEEEKEETKEGGEEESKEEEGKEESVVGAEKTDEAGGTKVGAKTADEGEINEGNAAETEPTEDPEKLYVAENMKEEKETDETINLDDVEKHKVLLLAMSTLKKKIDESSYKKPKKDEKIENCRGQLEPVAKLMLEELQENTLVDFVIMGTDGTEKEKEEKNILGEDFKLESANKYFINRIIYAYLNVEKGHNFVKKTMCDGQTIEYIDKEKNNKIRFNIVKVNENDPIKGLGDTVNKIREIYKEKEDIEEKLWIDIHGGYRDITFIMSSLLSLLKNEGIELEKIYSVREGNSGEPGKIFEAKEMFEMSTFVTGMNDFFNFGSVEELKRCRDYPENTNFIDALDLIAQGTQLSAPYLHIEGMKNLIKYYNERKSESKDMQYKLSIFEQNIFNDFGNFLEMDPLSDDFEYDLIIAIIERCIKKKLYQQALTFIETFMPHYYYGKKILYYDESKKQDIEDRIPSSSKKECANLIFDLNLPNLKDKKNKNGKDVKKPVDISSKDVIDIFCKKTNKESLIDKEYEENGKILTPKSIFKDPEKTTVTVYDQTYKNLPSVEIKVKSKYKDNPNIVRSLFMLHKALKECRNMFNHGSADAEERPEIDNIDKAMRIYIGTVKKLN